MRQVNWTKLPSNKAEKTIFNSLKDEIGDIGLDYAEIMEAFKVPDAKVQVQAAPEKTTPEVVSLIGPKRTQSVNIFLKSCRMTPEEIIEGLRTFDPTVCTTEFLEKLFQNLPTSEELVSIEGYEEGGGDVDQLDAPEKFFRKISAVKGLKPKVGAYITFKKFPSQYEVFEPQIESLMNSIVAVRDSEKWKSIIKYVLALGNYINGSSNRGNAIGFRLDSLNKLRDTKTSDHKSNLLNFLVSLLEKNDASALTIGEDFRDLVAGLRVTFPSAPPSRQVVGVTTRMVSHMKALITLVTPS